MDDVLSWLQTWYVSHCDGDWEHEWGISISTLDNPGWIIKIDLEGTLLADRSLSFVEVTKEMSENDWIHCRVQDNVFEGAGGPYNLKTLLEVFRDWCEQESIIP